MNLQEWTIPYIQFKDAMKQQIVAIHKKDYGLEVEEKKKTVQYVVRDSIQEAHTLLQKDTAVIICRNTKENVHWVVKNWSALIEHQQLKIIFVNVEKNEKWILHPATHHGITESDSLEQGLLSMYDAAS